MSFLWGLAMLPGRPLLILLASNSATRKGRPQGPADSGIVELIGIGMMHPVRSLPAEPKGNMARAPFPFSFLQLLTLLSRSPSPCSETGSQETYKDRGTLHALLFPHINTVLWYRLFYPTLLHLHAPSALMTKRIVPLYVSAVS